VDGSAHGDCTGRALNGYFTGSSDITSSFEHMSSMLQNGSLEMIERTQCVTEYAKMVQPTGRNLLLVATNEDVNPKTNVPTGLPIDRPCMQDVENNTGVYWMSYFDASTGICQSKAANSYQWLCTGLQKYMQGSCAHRVEDI
jgi:hypothetical protein